MAYSHEAITAHGKIIVELSYVNTVLQLKVQDNAKGISLDKISSILKGQSQKHEGKGLGLSSAVEYLSQLGGNLTLDSKENYGTTVTLTFPAGKQPSWFPTEIVFIPQGNIMVLEDDGAMQAFWMQKLQLLEACVKIFSRYEEALAWYETLSSDDNTSFLVDYELVEKDKNGLTFLSQVKNKTRAYLITSHAEEVIVQEKVREARIWLIPKALASSLPIVEACSSERSSCYF